ncbi:uncharacterized protein Dwil_GK17819 [Drosophila willistoni]|uniref:Uncharacterized protein n=1 Tax=Drosophila willistoni TaxID=7260 RepID=B4N624_DROWI|nr:uncharacterized protein LOC6646286 [Drosophila willistoni]EDW79813.1 uncharacterized protein Dwil_GK17819 [Drosophila willistoni]
MKTTNLGLYAFRLTFGQAHGFTTNSSGPNGRVVTRSATMLAVFGIALSSFSLKQLLAKKHNKHNALRKL